MSEDNDDFFQTKTAPKSVPEMLRDAAEVYHQRSLLYGDNYKRFGSVMKALLPNGFPAESENDINRLGVFIQVVSKLTRYSENFQSGGHDDSLLDLSVYANMLRELDEEGRRLTDNQSRSV